MLRLIYGCSGSEKSEYMHKLIADDLYKGKKVILIVPERFSVSAEQSVTALCGDKNKLNLEILSFKRLCNRVFREYGGLCYNYAGKGGQMLIMWRALTRVKDELTAYKNLCLKEAGTIESILTSIISYKRAALSPEIFEEAAKKSEAKPELCRKLSDLAKIYESYNTLLRDRYDDPEEDLSRLYTMLEEAPFFSDKEVYVDLISAFTVQELNILKRALAQSAHLTVTLAFLPGDERPMLGKLKWCEEQLYAAAKEAGTGVEQLAVFSAAEKKKEDLRALDGWLFSSSTEPPAVPGGNITLSFDDDLYSECKSVAARILSDVQTGGRFSDHAVVARDLSQYTGVIDRVFESNGIPYTLTAQKCLSGTGACRLLSTALRLIMNSFRQEDLLSYLRSGYSLLDDEECFLLEDYVNLWNIEGKKRWLGENDFAMNPDGHTPQWRDESFEKLARINEIKKKLTAPLRQLEEDMKPAATVEERAAVFYEYIENMRLYGAIKEEEKRAEETNDAQTALFHRQTYKALCGVLDELVYAMGEESVSLDEFALMFDISSERKQMRSIPPGKDRVLISDAFNLKPGKLRVLHAVGLNEGIFPAEARSSGIFSPDEKNYLTEELKIGLPGNDDRAVYDEEYLCYSVLTLPDERLCLSAHKKNLRGSARKVSELYESVERFLGEEGNKGDKKEEDLLFGRSNLLDAALSKNTGAAGEALRSIFIGDRARFEEELKKSPLVSAEDHLSAETLAQIYIVPAPGTSQTRLETFVKCPLSYTLKYILKLKEKLPEDAGGNEIGSIIHEVFEKLFSKSISDGKPFGEKKDGELVSEVKELLGGIKERMVGKEEDTGTEQLFRRIEEPIIFLSQNLRDEFAQSAFEPVFCELSFGKSPKGDEGLALPGILCGGERPLTVVGTVDRVDVYRKDGKIYLRVVDYKTGAKTFSEKGLAEGQNMQMPLYMRALLSCRDKSFKEKIGAGNGEDILPAGMLYYIAGIPRVEYMNGSEEEKARALRASVKRAGLLIDDKEVLSAMDASLKGDFIPYSSSSRSSAISPEDFKRDLEALDGTISSISERMRAGEACALPGTENCQYCPMKPLCRTNPKNNKRS